MIKKIEIDGIVLEQGQFKGKSVYIFNKKDLLKLDHESVAFIFKCPKPVAVKAMQIAGSSIYLGKNETSHLQLCTKPGKPFALTSNNLEEIIKEGINVEIKINQAQLDNNSEKLPKVKTLYISQKEMGQKGARLYKLERLGFKVPKFEVINFNKVNSLISKATIENILRDFINLSRKCTSVVDRFRIAKDYSSKINEQIRYNLDSYLLNELKPLITQLKFPISIRSNANLEDLLGESMAGAFLSKLNVIPEKLNSELMSVIGSLYGEEILINYPNKLNELKMSVIMQEMVKSPFMGGAVFLNPKGRQGQMILEANFMDYGDKLMDETKDHDIKIITSYRLKDCNFTLPKTKDRDIILSRSYEVFSQALEIYKHLGCDDLEFCVDTNGNVYWLQARPLPHLDSGQKKEKPDFFSFTSHASNLLHFRTYESNGISNINTDLNYTSKDSCKFINSLVYGEIKDIQRSTSDIEFLFNEDMLQSVDLIKKVTKRGREIEEHINQVVERIDTLDLEDLYGLMTLHAGLRAGSFGFRSRNKELYKQGSWKEERNKRMYSLMTKIIENSNLEITLESGMNLLYTPETTTTTIRQMKIAKQLHESEQINNENIWDYLLFQLRHVPNLSSQGEQTSEIQYLKKEKQSFLTYNIKEVSAIINELEYAFEKKKEGRQKIIECAKKELNKKDYDFFIAMSKYLSFKGEVNETHPYYRGKILYHMGKILQEKEIDPDNTTYEEVITKLGFDKSALRLFNVKPAFKYNKR